MGLVPIIPHQICVCSNGGTGGTDGTDGAGMAPDVNPTENIPDLDPCLDIIRE